MSNSNSQAMTLEERLVQHIKETGLGVLITDEDAITELTRRAVAQALIEPRKVQDGWRTDTQPSPVVLAARQIADAAVKQIVDAEVKRLVEDPATMKVIRECIIEMLPKAVHDAAVYARNSAIDSAAMNATQRLQELVRQT